MTTDRNHMGEKEYRSYYAWKHACRSADPLRYVRFDGGKDICFATHTEVDGVCVGVGEWDGENGVLYRDVDNQK